MVGETAGGKRGKGGRDKSKRINKTKKADRKPENKIDVRKMKSAMRRKGKKTRWMISRRIRRSK